MFLCANSLFQKLCLFHSWIVSYVSFQLFRTTEKIVLDLYLTAYVRGFLPNPVLYTKTYVLRLFKASCSWKILIFKYYYCGIQLCLQSNFMRNDNIRHTDTLANIGSYEIYTRYWMIYKIRYLLSSHLPKSRKDFSSKIK